MAATFIAIFISGTRTSRWLVEGRTERIEWGGISRQMFVIKPCIIHLSHRHQE